MLPVRLKLQLLYTIFLESSRRSDSIKLMGIHCFISVLDWSIYQRIIFSLTKRSIHCIKQAILVRFHAVPVRAPRVFFNDGYLFAICFYIIIFFSETLRCNASGTVDFLYWPNSTTTFLLSPSLYQVRLSVVIYSSRKPYINKNYLKNKSYANFPKN